MQPRHPEPRGTDPDGVLAQTLLDGVADCLPQGVTLAPRRRSQERSQMGIGSGDVDWERSDQQGVSTEIGEGDDADPRVAPGELLGKWLRVRTEIVKRRDIDQNELKLAIDAGAHEGRALPAVGLEGSVEENVGKPVAEASLTGPELDGFRVAESPLTHDDPDPHAPLPHGVDLGLPHVVRRPTARNSATGRDDCTKVAELC